MPRALSANADIITTIIGATLTIAAVVLLAGPAWAILAAGLALLAAGLFAL